MSRAVHTRTMMKQQVHAELRAQAKRLHNLTARVPDCGVMPDEHLNDLKKISETITLMRDYNIALGYLEGVANKDQAKMYGMTPSRVSQIIKDLLRS